MNKNKVIYILVGFIIVGFGFFFIIFSFVGVKFFFLVWIDDFGVLFGFVIKFLMIISGIVMIYFVCIDFSGEELV